MPSEDVPAQRPPGLGLRRRAARACLCCRARKVRCDYVIIGKPCTNCKLDSCDCIVQSSRRRKWPQLVAAALEQQDTQKSPRNPSPECGMEPSPHLFPHPPSSASTEPDLEEVNFTCSPDPHLGADQEAVSLECRGDILPVDMQKTMSMGEGLANGVRAMQGQHYIELAKFLNNGVTNASRESNLLFWNDEGLIGRRQRRARTSSWESSSDPQRSWPHALFSPALFRDQRLQTQLPRASSPAAAAVSSSSSSSSSSISLSSVMKDLKPSIMETDSFLIFSCYHFVAMNSLWILDQEDTKLLERKGCLHLPRCATMDELINKYFSYVHPTFPLLDEASFRGLYEGQLSASVWAEPLSLCVMQAVIFAACPFVSSSTLQSLGFCSVREARTHFYNVCEAMLRIDKSIDHISIAQCALLLTYHAPTIDDETNTQWLKRAIKIARESRAHQYNLLSDTDERKPKLKRLWWCCLLRDRIMALGLRRSLEIKPEEFDFSLPGLSEEDLKDEIGNSLAYNPATKRALAELLTLLCDFAVTMNGILLLCYGPEPNQVDGCQSIRFLKDQVYRLDGWYDTAVSRIQGLRQASDIHNSAAIFTNAIYIYYFTARACIYDQLMLEVSSHGDSEASSPYEAWHAADEVDEAVCNITESFRQLEKEDATRYLSNTFVAFSALPFLWQVEKSKQLNDSVASREEIEKDLVVYRELFKSFSGLYDMTDSVWSRLKDAVSVSISIPESTRTDLLEDEILRYPLI